MLHKALEIVLGRLEELEGRGRRGEVFKENKKQLLKTGI